jgi:hypothetical protein
MDVKLLDLEDAVRPNAGNWVTPPPIGEARGRQLRDALTDLPVTRMRTLYGGKRPLALTVVLMECADYPMRRRLLRGIRDRAGAQSSASTYATNAGADWSA